MEHLGNAIAKQFEKSAEAECTPQFFSAFVYRHPTCLQSLPQHITQPSDFNQQFQRWRWEIPITINVAACLVSQCYTVAVVSNDIVFRHKRARDEQPPTGSLISQVDFYDEREFLARPDSQSMKVSASFDDLINRYDFVLLDINRNPEFTRRCADLVIAVLDSDCRQSINGAESFIAHLKSAK